jgi:hypothetical protein
MRTEAIDWLGVLATEEEIRNNNLGTIIVENLKVLLQ